MQGKKTRNVERMVEGCEKILQLRFPASYLNFLVKKKSALVDGFKVMGLVTDQVPMSVVEATEILRMKRPDLPRDLAVVIFVRTIAVCLDLSRMTDSEVPLVEVDLESNRPPVDVGQSFDQWLEYHELWEKRFRRAWTRVRNRQVEARGLKRIQDWSTPIFRVQDYVIGIGAFKFSYEFGCLEVDEFLPIPQPHLEKDEPVKILISEAFARARDYCGSLNVQFTQDTREDESGVVDLTLKGKRIRALIPMEILELAKKHSIDLPHPLDGFISHEDAVNLWFSSLGFPKEVEDRIRKIEEAGYLKREIVAEIISLGYWTREEAIWVFINTPRPEALLMGSDCVEDRPSYVESMNYGRAAIMATKLKYAVIAEMTGGFTLEDIEKTPFKCEIKPQGAFWIFQCSERFFFPDLWQFKGITKNWFEANKPVLVLCRPHMPGNKENEKERLHKYLDILVNANEPVQTKCLVLSNEYTSPYYCKFLEEISNFVEYAREKDIHVIFAPTRTDLYLDQELQSRMHKVKVLTRLPSRQEVKKLQLFEVPKDCWQVPENSRESRAIQNAFQSVLIFGQQLIEKREVQRYEMEFSLMCEVIEREASQNHRLIAEIDGNDSKTFLDSLKHNEKSLKGVTIPFVAPEEMPRFLQRLKSDTILDMLKDVHGGIVVIVKPWEYEYIPAKLDVNILQKKSVTLPPVLLESIDKRIQQRKTEKLYASPWIEIERAHKILRQALSNGTPFAIASIKGGKVRSCVFGEMVKDYLYQMDDTVPIKLRIAYGDGSQGGPFPLFSLPKKENIIEKQFFTYNVGLISMRHLPADMVVDRYFVRNRDIQNRATAADQEELAFMKTYECLDELLRYIKGELKEKDMDDLSPSLRILLGKEQELRQHQYVGMHLNLFQTTGLESAGIGTYRAIMSIIEKYRGQVVAVPLAIIPNGNYMGCEAWF